MKSSVLFVDFIYCMCLLEHSNMSQCYCITLVFLEKGVTVREDWAKKYASRNAIQK